MRASWLKHPTAKEFFLTKAAGEELVQVSSLLEQNEDPGRRCANGEG